MRAPVLLRQRSAGPGTIRARQELVPTAILGLSEGDGPRRVPVLRRDEPAQPAGTSVVSPVRPNPFDGLPSTVVDRENDITPGGKRRASARNGWGSKRSLVSDSRARRRPGHVCRDMYAVHTMFRSQLGLATGLLRAVADGDMSRCRPRPGRLTATDRPRRALPLMVLRGQPGPAAPESPRRDGGPRHSEAVQAARFLALGEPLPGRHDAASHALLDADALSSRHCHALAPTRTEGVEVGVRVPKEGSALRVRFVVACDGGRGLVRQAARIDFPGIDATLTGTLGDFASVTADADSLVGRRMPDVALTAKGSQALRAYELTVHGDVVPLDFAEDQELGPTVEHRWGSRVRTATVTWYQAREDLDGVAEILVRPDEHVAWATGNSDLPRRREQRARALTAWAAKPSRQPPEPSAPRERAVWLRAVEGGARRPATSENAPWPARRRRSPRTTNPGRPGRPRGPLPGPYSPNPPQPGVLTSPVTDRNQPHLNGVEHHDRHDNGYPDGRRPGHVRRPHHVPT